MCQSLFCYHPFLFQQLSTSTPTFLNRFSKYNKGKPYSKQVKPGNFALLGSSNCKSEILGEPIKPFAPYQNPAKLAVYEQFVDYNDKDGPMLQGIQYWKTFWDYFEEYLRHPESKFDGDFGVLERKGVLISDVLHIGKESNGLEESEILGLNESSYEIYENKDELERKFFENKDRILKLKPKDVKNFYISRQTLWNIKNNIISNKFENVSKIIKIKILDVIME